MKPEWTPGNQFTLLENGEAFYPRVFEAIANARHEVLLETFILFDDKVGRGLRDALLCAARRGAQVHVLVDGWGSPDLPTEFVAPLVEAGVSLRVFEPAVWLWGSRVNMLRRMHRKLVVVDEKLAFVGGINYSIDHLEEFGPKAKQDYAVEVTGPLVAQVHGFCRASLDGSRGTRRSWRQRWKDQRANKHTAADVSEPMAAFVTRDNVNHRTDIEQQYRVALRRAKHRVVIANAYFFPGYRLLKDLRRAARRGVQVDLILQGEPDMPIVKTVATLLHAHLIRAGVRIHEYCKRPLHGKVAVIDDEWATVGSSNLDPTSLGLNLEANIFMRDRAFAVHLRERLDDLLTTSCHQVSLPAAGPATSAWIQVRSFFVFHFLRSFPAWAMRLPQQQPEITPLQANVG
jgi:cardiolipin synthase A/B